MTALREDGHLRTFLIVSLVFTIIVASGKGSLDLFLPCAIAWTLVSLVALSSRNVLQFVGWNVALLLADSVLDIAAMGQHMPNLEGTWIVPWAASATVQAGLIAYWVLLWGIAMPSRTLAMLDRITTAGHATKVLLFLAVIGLHLTFVEDVVYFLLLGYPPLLRIPPHNYAYLPHPLGLPQWNAYSVWTLAAFGLAFFIGVVVFAIAEERRLQSKRGTYLRENIPKP